MEVPWRGALCLSILCFIPSIYTSDPACKSCKGAGGPFLEGNVYKYQLEGSTVTHLPGSSNEVASLGLSASVEVFAESKCQHVLRLSNVQVKGPDGKKYDGLAADCAKPIKFSYNDGKLMELCGAEDDRGSSLNIKRAVISLLSSAKRNEAGSDTGYESDVFGICPTDFIFSKDGTKLKIHKSKNLNRCAMREEFNFPFPSTTYQAVESSFGAFETSPLIGAELKVDQELDNGVIQKATGEEVYSYRPFVNAEAGATVKVSYTLTHQGSSAGSIPATVSSPKVMFYETAHDDDGVKNKDAIIAALNKATAAIEPVATSEAAKLFSNLVYIIEKGSKADVLAAYNSAQGKVAKNLLLDGLLYAGSAESVEAVAELLNSKVIPEESALHWYLDLNFVKHVSRSSLKALEPLLSGNKVPHQAYLGIGAVAGKFCLDHRSLCETSPEFQSLQTKLAAPLDGGCKVSSHEQENTIIASLKGLRNSRHLTNDVAEKVIKCATDKTAKSRVRVVAIEALSADATKSEVKDAATSILNDVEEDSELRIKAYLVLVEAPCPKVADTVKHLVDNEPINQVGSFVVSHLRNLRATVNPEKSAAKHLLGNIMSQKKFPFDQRKFSRNTEVSYQFDALNVGAVGEVNRIFSQKSFIHRSVSMNLTTQIFGHSVNLAEIEYRVENLEKIIERYFGTKGLIHTKGIEVVDEIAEKAKEVLNSAKQRVEAMRPKRSVSKQEADAATNKIELGPDYEDDNTDLDISIKLFGSDVAWINYHHNHLDYENIKEKMQGKLDESLDKSKNIDINYQKGRKFLDAGVTYPTGLGFGLKVEVDGNSAVNMKINGKADIKALINHPRNTHIAFQVMPSANIELSSLLSIDAHVVESGVRVSANMHSSTGVDVSVKVLDGYGVDVKLGMPLKKQEIVTFQSDVVSVVRENKGTEVESPIKFNVKRQEHGGCFDQLSPLTGLTFCGQISIPMEGYKMLSPAYGPSKASVHLEKDDESLTSYHFKAFYNNKQPDQVSLEVLLDTPNSKTSRKFALNMQGMIKPQKQLIISLVSPFKQADFDGKVIDTETEQAISAKLISDGAEYSFKVGAHVSGDENHKKYEPLLEYKYPESAKSDRAWIGRKGAAKGKSQQSTVGLTGAIFVDKAPDSSHRKYELKDVTLTTPKMKLVVDGTVTIDTNLVASDIKATYDKDSVTLNLKVQKLEDHKYIAKIELLPSQYPELGGSVKWEYEQNPHKLENKLVVVHGSDLDSETHRISVMQLLKYKYESAKVFDFETDNSVSYPLLAVSGSLKGAATPKSLQYDVDLVYEKSQVKSSLDAKVGMKHLTDYSIDFQGKALGNSIDLKSKHERLTPTKSKFTNSLEMKPGGKYQLIAVTEFNTKNGDIRQSLDAEFKMPQDPKTVKVKTSMKHSTKEDEFEVEILAGTKRIIDIEYELKKKAEPSGKYKFLLPKYVDSEGSFETKDGKATGTFHVDLVKTGRKIQGNGELTKTGPHFQGSGDIMWDAKKDPNKKVHLETDTNLSGTSIDSKNVLQYLEHKTSMNVKGSQEGSWKDGTTVADVDITLPCGRVLAAKVNRMVHLAPDNNKIESTWELKEYASKGAQPRKAILKVSGKNINLAKLQFDGQVDLTYVCPEQKDVTLHLVGKKIPQGDKWTISGQGSVTGSMIKHPLEGTLNAEVSDQLLRGQLLPDKKLPPAHYNLELKAGSDVKIVANGKLNQDQIYNEIDLKLPSDLPVSSLKWKTTNTLNAFASETSNMKVTSYNDVHWNGDQFVKVNVDAVAEKDGGHGKVSWESHKYSLRTVTYKGHIDRKTNKGDVDLAITWEGKTSDIKVGIDASSNPMELHIISNVPDQGKYEVNLSHKVTEDWRARETLISATANDKKLVYHSKYHMSTTNPYVDVNLEVPEGKSRLFFKVDKKEEDHSLFDVKVDWLSKNELDFSGEANLKSVQDFYVKVNAESPKLKWSKVELEAKSSGSDITFSGKNGDQKISGSMTLASKGTLPNVHYEGNGNLKVGEKDYPLEFKFVREFQGMKKQVETHIKGGEHKFDSVTTIEVDEQGTMFKQARVTTYCNEKGCKSDKIKTTFERKGLDFEHAIDVELDFTTHLLLDHPLVFVSHSKKEGWSYDSMFKVEYGTEKLNYHGYIDDNHAGSELTLPNRVIASEVTYDFGIKKSPITYKVEASFWLDKVKSPTAKTTVLVSSETNKLPDGVHSISEARFNTPGLKEMLLKGDITINTKDRVISVKVEADVFAKKNQKLFGEYKAAAKKEIDSYSASDSFHFHSKGLNHESKLERKIAFSKTSFLYSINGVYLDSKQGKREGIIMISADPKSFNFKVKIPEATLFSSTNVIEKGDKYYRSKGSFEVLGYKFDDEVEIKSTHLKASCTQKTGNNAQYDFEMGFTTGQVAEISAKFNSKPLASLEIALDEAHFLKTKHSYNTDVAKEFVKHEKETAVGMVKEASKIFKETGAKWAHEVSEKVDVTRKALPNIKPAAEHYRKELQKLKEEMTSNKNMKDILDFLKNTFGMIFSQISGILQEMTTTMEHLFSILNEAVQKVTDSVKATIPKLKENYEKASEIVIGLLDDILKNVNTLVDVILDKIKEHDKEIQEVITVVTDLLHDAGQLFAKTFGELHKEIKVFITELWEQIQALPAFSMMKEKLQELKSLKIPDQYWDSYHEGVTSLVDILPTMELKALLKSLADTFEKIVKQEPVQKSEILQQLYREFVAAIRSVIAIIEQHGPQDKPSLPGDFFLPMPLTLPTAFVAPTGSLRMNLVNWLRSSDLPSVSDFFHTYRPRHSPIDILPPYTASAQLVGGTEFITYDRKHFSFKGSCSYILTKDVIDANFTVVANMDAGKLKSITVFDHVNSIELMSDNTVLFNGNAAELPIHEGDLHMFNRMNTGTGFATPSGFWFFCTPHLMNCAFKIDGFYFGKTRGLLGTYNNEPYDDITVPNGKHAKSTSEFANSWKVSPQCAEGTVPETPAAPQEECTKIFTSNSLRSCFPFENTNSYREACNRKVAEAPADAKQETACLYADAYAGYCHYVHFVKASLPDFCGTCKVGSQSIKIGESVQVKAPSKEADIVFIVEQLEDNEEVFKNLVTPLVSTLTNDLKEKGITDINYVLIGFNPNEKYPAIYTFNGKYNGFSGTSKNIYFAKQTSEVTEPKLSDRLKEIKKRLNIEIGHTSGAMALNEALNYPFRPEAVKAVVGVVSSTCDESVLPYQPLRLTLGMLKTLNTGVVAHLVTPLKDLKLEGKDEKAAAGVVGFDSHTLYSQSEAKKKVMKGDEEAFKNLQYTSDVCTDFTLGVNGVVFSSTNFVNGKPNFRKNFLQVLSGKITESLTDAELTSECKCVHENGLFIKTKCKIISKKERGVVKD